MIRWQEAKRRAKIKAFWEQLAAKGMQSPMYGSIVVALDNELVEKYIHNDDY